jgi:D-arabinose 1-dehydrogenase-like Zn-dependent alcohol dehydrogenase
MRTLFLLAVAATCDAQSTPDRVIQSDADVGNLAEQHRANDTVAALSFPLLLAIASNACVIPRPNANPKPLPLKLALRVGLRQGRAALVGITERNFEVSPYHELINREAEVIGVSDHLATEIPLLLEFARTGKLNLANVVTRTVPLDAAAINDVLDRLEHFGEEVRIVITP